MKFWRHIAQRLTWILIFTFGFIPLGVHAQAGVLLCIEADGHITIELAQGLTCATDLLSEVVEESNEDHDAEVHLSEDLTHCVDCIDVLIKGASDSDCGSFVVAQSQTPPSPSLSLSMVAPSSFPAHQQHNVAEAKVSPLPDSHLAILSTIVILS